MTSSRPKLSSPPMGCRAHPFVAQPLPQTTCERRDEHDNYTTLLSLAAALRCGRETPVTYGWTPTFP